MNSSAEFAELWGRHDVGEATRGRMRVIHPLVGELNLDWDAYPMPGAPGPVLFVCTAPQCGPDAVIGDEVEGRDGALPGPPDRVEGSGERDVVNVMPGRNPSI
jgi:hypothetical protein